MQKAILITAFFMCVLNTYAVNTFPINDNVEGIQRSNIERLTTLLDREDVIRLKRKDIEHSIHRKLSLKEKFILRLLKRKLKRNADMSPIEAIEDIRIDGLGMAGFILGILSFFILPYGILLSILGLIFSAIAMKRIQREPEKRKGYGFALAGLILSIVSIALSLVLASLLFFFIFF